MPITKRHLVSKAFELTGLSTYEFDISPAQYINSVQSMDYMVGGFESNGIRISYPISTDIDQDIDATLDIPFIAIEAIIYNLAIRLGVVYGKQLSPDLKQIADDALANLHNQCGAPIPLMQYSGTLPRGQGSKPWRFSTLYNYMGKPKDPLITGPDFKEII